jgi:hypothetical protein
MVKSKKTSEPRLTPEAFVLQAIAALKTEKFKGVHAVRSGFNQAFREYFGDEADPISVTCQMRKDGKIAIFPLRGGVSLYLRKDLKESTLKRHDADWARRDAEEVPKAKHSSGKDDDDDTLSKILKG